MLYISIRLPFCVGMDCKRRLICLQHGHAQALNASGVIEFVGHSAMLCSYMLLRCGHE